MHGNVKEGSDAGPEINLAFAHTWEAKLLARRPLILPRRSFVFPQEVEEVERGALEVLVRPPEGSGARGEYLATFALGFADPAVPTGVWSCPDPQWMCAVAGGYAYLVNTAEPRDWMQVEYRPVLTVIPLAEHGLLLFSGHQSLVAYGVKGKAWETGRLSWEGFQVLKVEANSLTGLGWDLATDRDFEFDVDLRTGEHLRRGEVG